MVVCTLVVVANPLIDEFVQVDQWDLIVKKWLEVDSKESGCITTL